MDKNEFDSWNEQKKLLNGNNDIEISYPKESEVWMCSVGKNIGFEQNGSGENFSRPVLIIKKFNNKMFWAISLSSKQKNIDYYYNFTDPNNLNVSLILAQLKLVSIKRLRRKIYDFPNDTLALIKTRLINYLK